MRVVVVVMLLGLAACQPAVRYTADGTYTPPSRPDSSYAGGSYLPPATGGSIDQQRMGKIIAGYLGTPYMSGGTGRLGLDCSGLVYVVYHEYDGGRLPNNTDKLYKTLPKVDFRDVRYGDLIFFSLDGSDVSHVGIYVGNNKFVHASKTAGVTISSMEENYYRDNYRGSRRARP